MSIVITKASVRRALEAWFVAARAGETLSARETAALSASDAAAQSSDFLFQTLADDEDSFQYEEPGKVAISFENYVYVPSLDLAQGQIAAFDGYNPDKMEVYITPKTEQPAPQAEVEDKSDSEVNAEDAKTESNPNASFF